MAGAFSILGTFLSDHTIIADSLMPFCFLS